MSTAIEILATVTDVLFLIWFVPKFSGRSLKERPIALVWAGLLLIFQLVADRILPGASLLYAIIDLAIVIAFALSLSKDKRLWNVFSAFAYFTVIMLSNTLVFSVFSLFVQDFAAIVQGSIIHIRILYILVCKMMHLSFYRLLLLAFKKEKSLDLKNSLLSFLFTLITAFGLAILVKVATFIDFDEARILITVLALFLIALNIILYLMINQVQSLLKSKYELSLIRERMESEKSRMEEVSTIWGNIRKLKHDLKNHFTVLNGKLEEGDTDSCKKYLSELNQTVESMGNLIKSGNSVIDYLINSKLSNIGDVQVLISGYVGNYSDIEDIDLACILGNIIDNAIEAQTKVRDEKRIELHFLQMNASRIIICKNTISESVLQKNKTLKSTKDSTDLHGLGHQIVENTVQKYNGMINYFEENEMFGVHIILPEISS